MYLQYWRADSEGLQCDLGRGGWDKQAEGRRLANRLLISFKSPLTTRLSAYSCQLFRLSHQVETETDFNLCRRFNTLIIKRQMLEVDRNEVLQ